VSEYFKDFMPFNLQIKVKNDVVLIKLTGFERITFVICTFDDLDELSIEIVF